MTSEIVLDASALLAMIWEEPGGEAVAAAIGRARMSTVNFAEVVSYLTYAGLPADQVDAMLIKLPMRVIDADLELAWTAGRLRRPTAEAGLSLGDRFALRSAPGTDFRSGPRIGNGEPLPISWTWRLSSFASRPAAVIHDLPASRHMENPVWLERIWDNGSRHLISSINKA